MNLSSEKPNKFVFLLEIICGPISVIIDLHSILFLKRVSVVA